MDKPHNTTALREMLREQVCCLGRVVASHLVSDDVVREGPMVALLTKAESLGSRILVVSIAHDAGERLSRLGGIAALHRYPYDPRDS